MSLGSQFKTLPGWAKGAIALTIVSAILFVSYTAYNWLKDIFANKDQKQTVNEADKQLKDLAKEGIVPNYNDLQYKSYADQLESAFEGYGTDNGQVLSVFNAMKNDADIIKLILAFDVRKISSGVLNLSPDVTGNLVTVISDEMSAHEIAKINDILSNNNIRYRF